MCKRKGKGSKSKKRHHYKGNFHAKAQPHDTPFGPQPYTSYINQRRLGFCE